MWHAFGTKDRFDHPAGQAFSAPKRSLRPRQRLVLRTLAENRSGGEKVAPLGRSGGVGLLIGIVVLEVALRRSAART
jgi:hypothetical protein